MIPPMEELFRSPKLFSPPEVYLRVREVLDRPDYRVEDVAQTLSQDPSLTARLLRIVNSPFYGLAAQIDNLKRAVTLLGPRVVHDLVLASVVAERFSRLSVSGMDVRRFWRDSVYCGVVARLLAKRCDLIDSERLFLTGLLRDIGHLPMYQRMPELCGQAITERDATERQLFEIEHELIGYDFTRVGGELLKFWTLPQILWEPILLQTTPEKSQDFPLQTAIIHMAGAITDYRPDPEDEEPSEPLIRLTAWRITNLRPQELAAVRSEAKESLDEAVGLMIAA